MDKPSHPVHDFPDGTTSIAPKAIVRAIENRLGALRAGHNRLAVRVAHGVISVSGAVQTEAQAAHLSQAIETRLDIGFLIDLGIPDMSLEVEITAG